MKNKIILSSVLAIILCASIAVGATFAIFTSESQVNIAVTSGKVKVVAAVDNATVQTKQLNTAYASGLGGTFAQKVTVSGNSVVLDKFVPGDGVKFDIVLSNSSNVNVKYRTKWYTESDNGLLDGLTITVDGEPYDGSTVYGKWTNFDGTEKTVSVEILLAETKGNEFQDKSCELTFYVEAVQGNADKADLDSNITYIYNVTDLKHFRNKVNNGTNFAGKTIMLMDDIDLNNELWTPITTQTNDNGFIFDGNGKTISNLKVVGEKNVGLFGAATNCKIVNLTVDNANVAGINHVAAIAGDALCTKIEGCTVTNSTIVASVKNNDDGDKAGAIAGYLSAESNAYVKGCTVKNVYVEGYRDIGALVGYANAAAVISGNVVEGATILNNRSVDYKAYTADNLYDCNAIVGEYLDNTVDSSNTATDVTIKAMYADGFYLFEGVYQIENANGLKYLATSTNNGTSYSGKTVMLMNDIDLNNEEWTPIGTSANVFKGTFDGNGKTISNLKINKSWTNDVGLFGFTTNGLVKNFTLHNAVVKGYLDVGAVAGSPYTSKYENIELTGLVQVDGYAYVGGMFGKNAYANLTDLTIDVDEGSYVKGDSEGYRTYVGGLVGFMGEGSHVVSNITSNIDVIGSTCDVGGIAGMAHYGNTFKNIVCTGNVTLTDAPEENKKEIGGIIGVWHNQTGYTVTITNCTFTGTVKAHLNGVEVTDLEHDGLIGRKYSADGTGKLIIDGVEYDA